MTYKTNMFISSNKVTYYNNNLVKKIKLNIESFLKLIRSIRDNIKLKF